MMKRLLLLLVVLGSLACSSPGARFLNDTFTDTTGVSLASHTGETGATWTLHTTTGTGSAVISDANRLRAVNATKTIYLASGVPLSADQECEIGFHVKSKNAEFSGPVVRFDSTAQSGYVAAWLNSTSKWQIYRIFTAASTLVVESSATSINVAQTYAVKLRVSGTFPAVLVELLVDGVVVASATDSNAQAPLSGKVGVWFQGISGSGNTVGYHFDSITGNDLVALSHGTIASDGLSAALKFTTYGASTPLLPAASVTGFSIATSGVVVSISSASRTASDEITLTLSRALYAYERPLLSYAAGNVTDSAGGTVATFSGASLLNGSTQIPTPGTNEVVLLGTQFGDAGTVGHELAKAFDGIVTNYFEAAGSEPHAVGRDAGTAVVLRRVRLTPRGGDGTTDFEERLKGAKIQGSNTSTSAGFVDLYAVPSAEPYYLPRLNRTEIPIYSGGTAYRYFRLLEATGMQSFLAEVEFVTDAGPALAKPVAPVVSPMGGNHPSGAALVTIISRTTSSAIYYTTDGTTPDNTKTLYSGPFTLTIGASEKTLKAVAYDTGLSTTTSDVTTAYFRPWGFKPSEDLRDDQGNLIEAHDGHVIYASGRFYWYGAFANKANLTGNPDTIGNKGVWCYSSADGYTWRQEGHILGNAGWKWLERPHVIYNASTGKYVLWAHMSNFHSSADRAGIAVADTPTGPWRWVNVSLNPHGFGFKDQTLFVDDDGTGYVVYSDQTNLYIGSLTPDYLGVTGTYVTVAAGDHREAPILFKRGSVYFLITSSSNYYDSSLTFDAKYIVNSGANPLTAWPAWSTSTLLEFPDPVNTVNNGQPTCVFKVPGKVDGYVYLADHFDKTALYDSRYVFRPLTFPTSTTLGITTPTSWDFSAFTDTAPSGNALLGGFFF